MLKKLEEMAKRFAEVQELIQNPDLIKDQKKYKEIMREHSHLTSVMEAYDEYKNWNENWIFPLEKPVNKSEEIENSCYWE